MPRSVTVISLVIAMLAFAASDPAGAQNARASAALRATELSAQARAPRPPRARTRIRVTPAYPYRLLSTPYPVPYPYEYPGPGAVRQCTSWLASENRLSGPVITPQMRCWWER